MGLGGNGGGEWVPTIPSAPPFSLSEGNLHRGGGEGGRPPPSSGLGAFSYKPWGGDLRGGQREGTPTVMREGKAWGLMRRSGTIPGAAAPRTPRPPLPASCLGWDLRGREHPPGGGAGLKGLVALCGAYAPFFLNMDPAPPPPACGKDASLVASYSPALVSGEKNTGRSRPLGARGPMTGAGEQFICPESNSC